MKNIVILISGSGSNMASIVRTAEREDWRATFNADIVSVISNRADAKGLLFATEHGIPTQVLEHTQYPDRQSFDHALMQAMDPLAPALIVLAGFMRILTAEFVAHYQGRMLNIHPSLLPAFAGLHTHQRAIQAGCRVAGATVHEVTAELDHGHILGQAVVPVFDGDTHDQLAQRVLTQEHLLYPTVIKQWLQRH